MSRNVEIEVFQIAKTHVNKEAVARWMTFVGANKFQIPDDETITDPAFLIAMAAKRCYKAFEIGLNPNVTKIRSDWTEYLDNVLKQGHGSVLAHASFTYAIENVSRVFTGELNRHGVGTGISEGSMRYIRYTDIPWWLPTSLREDPKDDTSIAEKKRLSRTIFNLHYTQTEQNYDGLQKIWADELSPTSNFTHKKHITSMMRRIIPMGVATGGVWTMNARAIRHIIAMRASEAAEEEILYVFSKIAKEMVESEPMLLGDFSQTIDGFWVPKYKKV
jgi:thymidylate synthase (FAD)